MKIFIPLSILILSSLLPASAISEQSDPIDYSDLVVRSGVYFKKFEDKPYTGYVKHDLEVENPRHRRLSYIEKKEKVQKVAAPEDSGKSTGIRMLQGYSSSSNDDDDDDDDDHDVGA